MDDNESVIGLTTVVTTKSTDHAMLKKALPNPPEDAWDERRSLERAQIGIGSIVTIQAAAGGKPVQPRNVI